MLINVKMTTIVGILTFMSRIYFVLSSVYEKFYNLGARILHHAIVLINQSEKLVIRDGGSGLNTPQLHIGLPYLKSLVLVVDILCSLPSMSSQWPVRTQKLTIHE